jgi:hypothetical protein
MPKRDDVTVKITAAIYRKAKMVATYRGMPLAEYLSETLKKPVDRDFHKLREEMGRNGESEPSDD